MTIENFNQFYDEYQRFSAYVAYCITKDKLLAEDISQEIFITFYKMKENLDYSDRKKLKALVLRATTNRCNDYFRKSSTKQEMCTFDEEGVEETPDESGDPESRLLRMEEETYQRLVLRKLRMRNPQNYDILMKINRLSPYLSITLHKCYPYYLFGISTFPNSAYHSIALRKFSITIV